jgi:hypothetical protein
MSIAKPFHPHTKLADSYYKAVLLALIEAVSLKLTSEKIAEFLNSRGLRQPNTKSWTGESTKHTLFRLKNSETHPNRLHSTLLKLVFAGQLTVAQVSVLFEQRKVGRPVGAKA